MTSYKTSVKKLTKVILALSLLWGRVYPFLYRFQSVTLVFKV